MRYRKLTGRVVIGCVAALAFGALGAPVGAQQQEAPLTVAKNVDGPVPEDTLFVVTLACEGEEGEDIIVDPDEGGLIPSFDFLFDADGSPQGADTVGFDGQGTCTVTETETGGADSVVYECTDNSDEIDNGNNVILAQQEETFCQSSGPQTDPMGVNIITPEQEVLVTVTNTFVEEEAEELEAPEPLPVEPTFTG